MLENGVVSIFTPDKSGDGFVKRGSFGAWIHHKKRLRNTGNGVRICDKFDVRIAVDKVECIEPGDLIAFGDIGPEEFSASECRRIAEVCENRFGTSSHWHLEAEYEYR